MLNTFQISKLSCCVAGGLYQCLLLRGQFVPRMVRKSQNSNDRGDVGTDKITHSLAGRQAGCESGRASVRFIQLDDQYSWSGFCLLEPGSRDSGKEGISLSP